MNDEKIFLKKMEENFEIERKKFKRERE